MGWFDRKIPGRWDADRWSNQSALKSMHDAQAAETAERAERAAAKAEKAAAKAAKKS